MAHGYKSFNDLTGDFTKDEVLFRLIHFLESCNFTKGNALMGMTLLFIDGQVFLLWSSPKNYIRLITNYVTCPPCHETCYVNLNSTSATRIFFNNDTDITYQYMKSIEEEAPNSFTTNSSSSEVTKLETITIREIHQLLHYIEGELHYIEGELHCTAKIVDILHQYGWYHIACSNCKRIIKKTGTSLRCYECNKPNIVGILRYHFKLSVQDNIDVATFVVFNHDGAKIAGKTADELANEYGQVKVTKFNFTASCQTITVSQILDDNVGGQPDSLLEELLSEKLEEIKKDTPVMAAKNAYSRDEEAINEINKDKRPRLK